MSNERKNQLTDFGIAVKTELLRKNKTQLWLVSEIKERDKTLYVDPSAINKVLTGKVRSGKIKRLIEEILGIDNCNRG